VQDLSSESWQKVFDALNVLKRVARHHREFLSPAYNQFILKDCFKGLVRHTENLRSQVAKNACITLQMIFSELSPRELDPQLDLVLNPLIKKSTDTNNFVSE